jgi:hypothetical protein
MKIKLTFLFAIFYFASFSQIEFAPIGAEWYFSRNEGTMPPDEGFTVYKVAKDTIIEGKSTRVIRKTYHHANGVTVTNAGNEYLYEVDKKVYCWKNQNFYLLYNFNAQPGESWKVYGEDNIGDFCNYDSLGVVVVDSVKTLKINGYNLKALYTSPGKGSNWGFNGVVLEHIGCVTHIFPQARECAVDIPYENGPLRCYEDSVFGKYKSYYWDKANYECDKLFYYTSISDDEYYPLNIFPNPVNDYLSIQGLDISNKNKNFHIEILNLNGQVIRTQQTTDKIFIGDFTSGVYLLRISVSPNVICLKFIKE